jgi:hypothetical protein
LDNDCKGCKNGPAKLTPEEAQQLIDFFNNADNEEKEIFGEILCPVKAEQIMIHHITGAVHCLTRVMCDSMLNLLESIPLARYGKIANGLDETKLEENANKIKKQWEKAKNAEITPIIAIKSDLIKPKERNRWGWVIFDTILVKFFEYSAYDKIYSTNGLAKVLQKKENQLSINRDKVITNFNDPFLKENDPDNNVKSFVELVVESINNASKENTVFFNRDRYCLYVIHRYFPKNEKNHKIENAGFLKIYLVRENGVVKADVSNEPLENQPITPEKTKKEPTIMRHEWKEKLFKKMVKIAAETDFKATKINKRSLIQFYNKNAKEYFKGKALSKYPGIEDLSSQLNTLLHEELTDCKDRKKYRKIVGKTIEKLFKMINNEKTK